MRKVNIVCVGKLKEDYLKNGINEYIKRLSNEIDVKIIEVDEYRLSSNNPNASERELIIENEGKLIIEKIKGYVICLCIEGKQYSSEDFSKIINDCYNYNDEITFIIGGSYGLSKNVKAKSNLNLSFSKFTFPHQLMRLILLEQIYRANSIIKNTPYHK